MRQVQRVQVLAAALLSFFYGTVRGGPCGLPCAWAQPSTEAQHAFDEAQALLAQKRPAEAIAKLKLATSLEPAFAPAWFALASTARRAGSCADAIPAYRRYTELRPEETEPLYGLGLCLRDSGDRAGAVATLKRFVALEHRPASARWVETARATIATLEAPAPPPAATALVTPPLAPAAPLVPMAAPQSAGAKTPSRAAGLYAEAQRLRDGGRIEEALKTFHQVADTDPDLMVARAAWGELLIKIRRDQEAIGVFRAAVQRNPQYPLAWYELGFTLRETGQLGDAVDAYQRYIQLRPNDPDPYYGLAKTFKGLGRAEDARRAYETYLALEKRPTEGRFVGKAQAELAVLRGAGGLTPSFTSAGGATSPPPRN